MSRRFLAFDIETAKDVPGDEFDWKPHRPLGISCIASLSSDAADTARIWYTKTATSAPAPKMTQSDIAAFVHFLSQASAEGLTPISWNGLAFDFDILAEESALDNECRHLARNHIDMMFHVVCEKGFPVALNSAAAGLRVPGKLSGVEGVNVPSLWANGNFDLVMEYVAQDVRTTLAVALEAERRRSFSWITRKGSRSVMPLPKGWLSVEAACRLPLPDTSWMSDPPKRRDFMS